MCSFFLLGVASCFLFHLFYMICVSLHEVKVEVSEKNLKQNFTSSLVITTQINILRNKSNSDFMD